MKGYIYTIENTINNKKYIGQTLNIDHRLKDHFSRLEKKTHHSIKLQRAYDKYGVDAFKTSFQSFEIDNLEQLYQLEMKFIEQNNSYHDGYNMTYGGEGHKTALTYNQSLLVYQIGKRYDGVGREIARYFECDHTVINDIFKNSTFENENFEESELQQLIQQIDLSPDNLKENYKPHNTKKLNQDIAFQLLSINEFHEGYLRLCSDLYGIHTKGIGRLIKGETYRDFYNNYYQLSEADRKQIGDKVISEKNLEHMRLMRKRNLANPLTQEQVNFILDNQDKMTRVAIGKILNISVDRVRGVITGKSYKDLIEIYNKNKSCRG